MLKFLLYWAAFHTLGRLPLSFLYALMRGIAWAAYYLAPGVRRNVNDNLRHVMPAAPDDEVRGAAKQVLRNVALYYADTAHLPRMDLCDFFERRFVFHGLEEYLRPAIAQGQGVIILSAHYGAPELAVQAFAHLGIHVFALTEPVHPRMSKLMDEYRASKGHTFGPVNRGNVKRVFQTLKSGGVVALMGDRDIEGPNEALSFFGEPTLMPTGPIEVAIRMGAPVIPCFSARRGKYGIEGWVEEPLVLLRTGDTHADVIAGTREYIERLERRLRAEPGQWAVIERIWDEVKEVGSQRSEVREAKSEVAAGERGDG